MSNVEAPGSVPAHNVAAAPDAPRSGGLRRELKLREAVAMSVGLMAPSAAMALNGTLPASIVGRAVPLAFVIATIGVLLVAYGFVRLTQHFNHAGSFYGMAGATLGPRAGFFAGWALMGTYVCYTVSGLAALALFVSAFLEGSGIVTSVDWIIPALIGALIVGAGVLTEIRAVTRTLLTLEALSIALFIALVAVIFIKLIGGTSPDGQSFDLRVFAPESGVAFSAVALASVYGFLSFAGFEGSAALGEETDNPKRNIPRALIFAVLLAAAFYLFCITAQSMGFGTDSAGVEAFASSSAPMADLGTKYVGEVMGDFVNVAAIISGVATGLGALTAAGRMVFALSRDAQVSKLTRTSPSTGAPVPALVLVFSIAVIALVAMRAQGHDVGSAFFYPATLGTLSLLVAYVVTTLGALRFLASRGLQVFDIVVPVLGIAFVTYVLWKNVSPVPDYPYSLYPYLVAGYLLVGLAIVVFTPGLSARIGVSMAALNAKDR